MSAETQAILAQYKRLAAERQTEVERLRERGDAVVHTAREVLHGREHSGALLLAMRAWEDKDA